MIEWLGNLPVKQVLLFCVVGVFSTSVDFTVYNLLTSRRFAFSPVQANVCSTTAAMVFSFAANTALVFQPLDLSLPNRAVRFILVTTFSLYVLQNLVIVLTSKVWLGPVRLVQVLAMRVHLTDLRSNELIARNAAKVYATIASLLWNFLSYKYFVYSN
jgi:putative flippase GtrA